MRIRKNRPIVIPDRWAHVRFRGVTVDNDLKYRLLTMERRLGYKLTCIQGINPGGVSQSAGTHDGPAIDLAPWDWARKVREGRRVALAMWHRLPTEGDWDEHEHGVPIGNVNLSPAAADQVAQYLHDPPLNGLKNRGPDTFGWRPDPVPVFDYEGAVRDVALTRRIVTARSIILTQRERIAGWRARITYRAAVKRAASTTGGVQ